MKTIRLFFLANFCLLYSFPVISQQIVGEVGNIIDQLKTQLGTSNFRVEGKAPLILPISPTHTLYLYSTSSARLDTSEVIFGKVDSNVSSGFRFSWREKSLKGFISLPGSKYAYSIHSNENGEVLASKIDIDQVMCMDFTESVKAESDPEVEEALQAVPPATSTVYTLQSFPSASAVAYLDFDGETVSGTLWAGGNTITASSGNFTETDIRNAFNLVSEDFRGFNINITTNLNVYNSAPRNRRMRCIFTPTNTAAPGAGGVAYIGSFTWGDDTPCWVFNGGAKNAGEAASHEIGHTLNLKHDGRTTPKEDYYAGQGNWAPIMGIGYNKSVVQWSKGEYPNANNKEDDINIISTRNGFGFRTDDFGNTLAAAGALTIGTDGSVSGTNNAGVIANKTDVDVFKFTTGGGAVALSISPAAAYPDLDVFAAILSGTGDTIGKYNPTSLGATISINLSIGTYFLSIDGVGAGQIASTGYSDYASFGAYTISGNIPQNPSSNVLPNVAITYPINNMSIDGPANVTLSANASDPDGRISLVEFFNGTTKLGEDATAPYSFIWANVPLGTYSVTARATDNLNSASNSIAFSFNVKKADCKVADSLVKYNAIIGTSGSYNNSGNIKEDVFDKDVTTYFDGPTRSGTYVGLELRGVYRITGIRYYPRSGYANRMLGGKFQASNSSDFSSAVVDLATLTANSAAGWNCLSVSNTNAFKYVRYLGVDGSYSDVAEIEFFGSSVANKAPAITLTAPSNNAILMTPASPTLTATATDPDGTIIKVEFFSDTTKLAQDISSPYSMNWNNVPNGTYYLKAKATDNFGEYTVSNLVKIIVKNPLCTLQGQILTGTAIGSTGSNNNSGNTFVKVFDNDTLSFFDASQTSNAWVGLDLAVTKKIAGVRFFPRSDNGSKMIGGKFQVSPDRNFARAVETLDSIEQIFENEWNCMTLSPSTRYRYIRYLSPSNSRSNIAELDFFGSNSATNAPPTAVFTSPANNSVFVIGTELPLLINAIDQDGDVMKVEIFANNQKLGELIQAPFVYNYENVLAETVVFTAVVTDDEGQAVTSQSLTVKFGGVQTGMSGDGLDQSLFVYPNPTQDFLTIKSSFSPFILEITDLKGTVVATYSIKEQEHRIDLGGLSKGVYLLKLQNDDILKMIKIVLK